MDMQPSGQCSYPVSWELSLDDDPDILKVQCSDRSGTHWYTVRLIHEFGIFTRTFDTREKVEATLADLYAEAKQHDVLFSDYTEGRLTDFASIFLNPQGVWFEIERETDKKIVGAIYLENIIHHFDLVGHFAVWDSIASGREEIFWGTIDWAFKRYDVRRISCEIPPYQKGTMRFVERLGFAEEGEKAEAIVHKGKWMSLMLYGMTVGEYIETLNIAYGGQDAARV